MKIPVALCMMALAAPGRADVAPPNSPGAGEIALTGKVLQNDPAAHSMVLGVTSFTLPTGKSGRLIAATPKTIVLRDATLVQSPDGQTAAITQAALAAGVEVTAIGKDTGSGKPLVARLIVAAAPAPVAPVPAPDAPVSADGPQRARRVAIVGRAAAEARPVLVPQMGHSESFVACALSPDGKKLATKSDDVIIWSLETGQQEMNLLAFEPTGKALASIAAGGCTFSPDGRMVAAGLVGAIGIASVETARQVLQCPLPHGGVPQRLAYSPDGAALACVASSYNGQTRVETVDVSLVDVQTGKVRWTLQDISDPARTNYRLSEVLRFNPDGKNIAVITGNDVLLLDSLTGQTQKTITTDSPVLSIGFSPDGRSLFTGSHSGLTQWDAATGGKMQPLDVHETISEIVAGDRPDSLALLGKSFSMLDIKTGLLKEFPGNNSRLLGGRVQFTPDLNYAAYLETNLTVVALKLTGERRRLVLRRHIRPVTNMTLSDDGKGFVSSAEATVANKGAFKACLRWDLQTGGAHPTAPGDNAGAAWDAGTVWNRDHRLEARYRSLAMTGNDYSYEVVVSRDNQEAWKFTYAQAGLGGHQISFSSDGKMMALRYNSRANNQLHSHVLVYDANSGEVLRKNEDDSVLFAVFNEGDPRMSLVVPAGVRTWDPTTGEMAVVWNFPQGVIAGVCGYHGASGAFAFSRQGGGVLVWSPRRGVVPLTLTGMRGYTYALASAFSPDGKRYAFPTQTGIAIIDLDTGRQYEIQHNQYVIRSLAFVADNARLLVGSTDGIVRLWDIATGQEVATFLGFGFAEGNVEWLATTPEGYYDCSLEGGSMVDWRLGDQILPFDQFERKFHRPDLLRRKLAGEDISKAPPLQGSDMPPKVVFADRDYGEEVTPDANGTVTLSLNAAGVRPIARLELTLNGRPLPDALARTLEVPNPTAKTRDFTIALPIPPNQQRLRLRAVAYDTENLRSYPAELLLRVAGVQETPGQLYLLNIGISRYKNNNYNLTYADADANSLATALAAHTGKLYAKVNQKVLTNDQATVSNVLFALRELKDTVTENDSVIVFVSGHGLLEAPGRYRFITHEVDPDDLAHTTIDWEQFVSILKEVRAKRLVLLADTCHAGSITGKVDTDVMTDRLNKNAGVVVFTASRGDELSYEQAAWGHGAFTKGLLEGLDGAADGNHDGNITLDELKQFVARQVAQLTGEKQHPYLPRLQQFEPEAVIASVR